MVKPEPDIFTYTLQQLDVLPDEAVFIDDRQENIDGAQAVGVTSILYMGADGLRQELAKVLK